MAAGVGLALVIAAATGAETPSLSLSCAGRSDTPTRSTGLNFLARGGVTTHTTYGTRREEARVLFRMEDGAARVHLPRSMVTAVNGGGEDGWWPVGDLRVTDDVITGRLHLNIVNRPGLHIDRTTGDIDVGGAYPFHGACEKAGTERKF